MHTKYQILTKEGLVFSFLAKLKQDFIKILNTNQEGTWSGPSPGNLAGE